MKILIIVIVIVLLVLVFGIWKPVIHYFDRGEITGIYLDSYSNGYGDLCGQYPNCGVRLKNYTVTGSYPYDDNHFHFGNQFDEILDLEPNQRYSFVYHKESRLSDTTSGNDIEYYVLESIWEK